MKKILSLILALMLLSVFCFTCLAETAAEPATPAVPMIDLTGLVVSIVILIGEALLAWLLKAIIPPAKKWLDSHTTKNQQTVIWNVVKRLVEAAEQIITGEGKGDEKLAWVEAQLRHYGYDFDRYAVEAAVKEMNDRSLAVIAEELDIPGGAKEKTEDE
jgi:hypothetical protein